MLSAVNHCHQHGVVHRDIKMENFLLDYNEHSGSVTVELTDFGLCQFLSNKRTKIEYVGTPICMAPEVI